MPHSYHQSNKMLTLFVGGGAAQSPPAIVYVALFTNPTAGVGLHTRSGTGGTECTGVSHTGYVRKQVTFSAPADGRTANSGPVEFVASTAVPWNDITAFGYFDLAAGGNFLGGEYLPAKRSYLAGQQVSFDAGALTIEN